MPCLLCNARQTDPARGPSLWKRGVQSGRQVLICPDCQRRADWTVGLDRCRRCGSTVLVRRLGETACRDCGEVAADPVGALVPTQEGAPGLADDVAAALERVLRRPVA